MDQPPRRQPAKKILWTPSLANLSTSHKSARRSTPSRNKFRSALISKQSVKSYLKFMIPALAVKPTPNPTTIAGPDHSFFSASIKKHDQAAQTTSRVRRLPVDTTL